MRWLSIFLDGPGERAGTSWELWRAVAGASSSPVRDAHGELAILVPPDGDAHLRVRAPAPGEPGVHLDLHVDDVPATAAHARAVGAADVDEHPGHALVRSPAGFAFCIVLHEGQHRPASPTTWPGGHRSRLDQLAVDVAHEEWERELAFWADLTGWEVTVAAGRPEFARLATPARLPVRVLLHRRRSGATAGHVDLATDDREAEVRRLEQLGLRRLAHGPTWTVMRTPHGAALCVTDRDPATGLLR